MKRIIIVGPSGAGKTTLAQTISRKLNIPHTELDSLWHKENWQITDPDDFSEKVGEITKQNEWILCGNYFHKLGGVDFWAKADTIIWCDYPLRVVLPRLFRRTLKRTISKEELWQGNRESFYKSFFSRDSIFLHLLKKYHKLRRRYVPIFEDKPESLNKTELIRVRSQRDIAIKLGLQ